MFIGAAVTYAPYRYNRVQMNTVSSNNTHGTDHACASLKSISLHCITLKMAIDVVCGTDELLI